MQTISKWLQNVHDRYKAWMEVPILTMWSNSTETVPPEVKVVLTVHAVS